MRKTALLTGVAGLFLMTAPAFAQDSTAPQTPPAGQAAEQQPAAQPEQLTLQPGSVVRDSAGAELGRLEGVRNGPSGQELTVRGSDGQLRGVPIGGIRQDGDAIVVDFSSGEFMSAPAITDGAPGQTGTTPPAPAAPATPATPATPADPMQPGQPAQPAQPAEPAAAPSASQPPAPGEGAAPAPASQGQDPAGAMDDDQPTDDDEPADDEPGA
ncbi:hypothetical protein [Brevundimonas sp.]|uniref:hypothetical protein n=1 Tax=Brevundimonas sp. TaxID=1871086 RepID=UPI0025C246EA|nr:hypothetical protein [Brevundimonas sp.]